MHRISDPELSNAGILSDVEPFQNIIHSSLESEIKEQQLAACFKPPSYGSKQKPFDHVKRLFSIHGLRIVQLFSVIFPKYLPEKKIFTFGER